MLNDVQRGISALRAGLLLRYRWLFVPSSSSSSSLDSRRSRVCRIVATQRLPGGAFNARVLPAMGNRRIRAVDLPARTLTVILEKS
jgi:hypothetical protein